MTESHEIDNLKRKVEDAKMKLVTEIKVTDFLWIGPTVSITYKQKEQRKGTSWSRDIWK